MTRHPIMVETHMPAIEAQKLMVENQIQHLPVVGSGKRLLGLVTRGRLSISPERLGSLDVWEITRYLSDLTVGKVMLTGPDLVTIEPEATLEDAAGLMIRRNVSGLPVVEDGIVVGIVTQTDLLVELRNMLGAIERGWRITVRVPNRKGEFHKLIHSIADRGWGIMAMGSARSPRHEDHWDVVLKIRRCSQEDLAEVIRGIEGQELIDIRETAAPEERQPQTVPVEV
jgi:acetoin utilization protein AcuB